MRHIIARTALALLVLVLLAPAAQVGAFALSGKDPLMAVELGDEGFEFDFVPQANSDYSVCIFSRDGGAQARARILEGDEELASGAGVGEICSAWLAKGVRYTVQLRGTGSILVEVARSALSRCYAQPLPAEENKPAGKGIARSYDAHWYAFEARADGEMLLTCVPEDLNLNLSAAVFDASGTLVREFDRLGGGACSLKLETKAKKQYFIRVSAPDGGVGYYALNLHRPGQEYPALGFDAALHVLAAGSSIDLAAELGDGALLWVSDAPEVVRVDQAGVAYGVSPGEAVITAYGMDSHAQLCIRVEYVALERLDILADALNFNVGDDVDIQVAFYPENASERGLRFVIADPEIAGVSRDGVLHGLSSGETELTVYNAAGDISDRARIHVAPAVRRYRALLVGEENYPFSDNPGRRGSETSVRAIESLLESMRFENAAWSVRTAKDLSRAELAAQIRSAFRGATPQDISLFYITCHGSYSGGMSFLELTDGSMLSVRDLERELRAIPGTVVVMIDCCASGGAIGKASQRAAFAKGITGAFSGAGIRGGKYRVIASAGLDEDSHRIAFDENAGAGVMATVFARALCDGAGWNIDLNRRGTMGADRNYDGQVSLGELQFYLQDRVQWYLDLASELSGGDYRQSVQVYPEGDPLVLFERKS